MLSVASKFGEEKNEGACIKQQRHTSNTAVDSRASRTVKEQQRVSQNNAELRPSRISMKDTFLVSNANTTRSERCVISTFTWVRQLHPSGTQYITNNVAPFVLLPPLIM